ncbi:MAG: hypothetical protein J6B50_10130 [Lachnospiraceae bacterium]|nr:hypothetical protein [Lachnospiraceae bacterium]
MKKITYVVMACLATVLLAGCSASKENTEVPTSDTEVVSEDTTEEATDSEEPTDTQEEVSAKEIVDILPLGPSEANYGKDNLGFYMEGEAFTLPMPYSEFLDKVTAMGFSVTDEERFNREGVLSDYVYYQVQFDHPVEGQEHKEDFTIQVVNSADSMQSVDLSDPSSQVVYFSIRMAAGANDIYDPDKGTWATNIHTDVYLTPEIGLGRNIDNLYSAWGVLCMN